MTDSYLIDQYRQALLQAADKSGVIIDQTAWEKSLRYIELLLEWNQKMNLTAITDPDGVAVRHFADSWTVLTWLDRFLQKSSQRPFRVIDIGTGAGFPGIPLKIQRPQIELVLFDSLMKRVGFLQTVTNELQFSDVKCLHGRAEESARIPELREAFDLVTARAVATLPVLCELCLPFVRLGGYFIAMKSRSTEEIEQSAKAIDLLGGKIFSIENLLLPDTDIHRSLVIIEKIKPTPKQFPRKAGQPKREPL